jgi:hypothetical protein
MYVYVYFEFLFMVHVVSVVIGASTFGLSSCLRCLFFIHCFAYVFLVPHVLCYTSLCLVHVDFP